MAGEPSKYKAAKVEPESTFATLNGSPWSSGLMLPMRPVETSGLKSQWIKDETATQDDGQHDEIEGSKAGVSQLMPCYGSGLGLVGASLGGQAGDTIAPLALDYIIKSMCGATEILQGDTIATAASATSFTLTDQSGLTTTGVVMIGVTISGAIYWRPCTIATGTVTLLYALPSTPSVGAAVTGSINHQWVKPPFDLTAESIQALFLDITSTRQKLALGGVLNTLGIAAPVRDLWKLDPNVMFADFDDNVTGEHDDAMVTVDPAVTGPHMAAQSFIAPAGVTTYNASHIRCLRADASFSYSRGLTVRSCQSNAQGIDGYNAPGNVSPFQGSTVLDRSATWLDAKKANTHYQMMFMTSRLAGKAFGFYEPEVLVGDGEPEPTVHDEILTTTVPWRRATGYTARHPVIFRA